jgi:hypothetical protein
LRFLAVTDIINPVTDFANYASPENKKRSKRKTEKEHSLDLEKIVSDLTAERDRIVRAIEALLESLSKRGPKKGLTRTRATGGRRDGMTPRVEGACRKP